MSLPIKLVNLINHPHATDSQYCLDENLTQSTIGQLLFLRDCLHKQRYNISWIHSKVKWKYSLWFTWCMLYVWTIRFKAIKFYSELGWFKLGLDDFLYIQILEPQYHNQQRNKRPLELNQNLMKVISFLQS